MSVENPDINPDRVELLASALESGNYAQESGQLAVRTAGDGAIRYCCLGVACEIAIANGCEVEKTVRSGDVKYGGLTTILPEVVMRWYGFSSPDPNLHSSDGVTRVASYWNDSMGADFGAIAAMFRDLVRQSQEGRVLR